MSRATPLLLAALGLSLLVNVALAARRPPPEAPAPTAGREGPARSLSLAPVLEEIGQLRRDLAAARPPVGRAAWVEARPASVSTNVAPAVDPELAKALRSLQIEQSLYRELDRLSDVREHLAPEKHRELVIRSMADYLQLDAARAEGFRMQAVAAVRELEEAARAMEIAYRALPPAPDERTGAEEEDAWARREEQIQAEYERRRKGALAAFEGLAAGRSPRFGEVLDRWIDALIDTSGDWANPR